MAAETCSWIKARGIVFFSNNNATTNGQEILGIIEIADIFYFTAHFHDTFMYMFSYRFFIPTSI